MVARHPKKCMTVSDHAVHVSQLRADLSRQVLSGCRKIVFTTRYHRCLTRFWCTFTQATHSLPQTSRSDPTHALNLEEPDGSEGTAAQIGDELENRLRTNVPRGGPVPGCALMQSVIAGQLLLPFLQEIFTSLKPRNSCNYRTIGEHNAIINEYTFQYC
ncbi:hypothetical protein SAMN06309944_2348 [Micrococcales bacterium KH10]|nr:hypothetical protein SAMN06309944_2348 [Micrococcales bacterium KH10]